MKHLIHNHFCTNYLVIFHQSFTKPKQREVQKGPIRKNPKVSPLLFDESVACLKVSIDTNKILTLTSCKEMQSF